MNKTAIFVGLMALIISIIVCFTIYQNRRYYIVGMSNEAGIGAYKLDRNTGKVWLIVANKEKPVQAWSINPSN